MDRSLILATLGKCLRKAGLLAQDEQPSTFDKRLTAMELGVHGFNRWIFREAVRQAPAFPACWDGAIYHEEQLLSPTMTGPTFAEALAAADMVPVVKIDQSLVSVGAGQIITGTTDIAGRAKKFFAAGARAAKLRWAFGPSPGPEVVSLSVQTMAAMARACLDAGLLPVVEPELERKSAGGTHTIADSDRTLRSVLPLLLDALRIWEVPLDLTIVKTVVVEGGANCPTPPSVQEVARKTAALYTDLLGEVGAILVLSGGRTPEMSLEHQNALWRCLPEARRPFVATSFSRAVLEPAFEVFKTGDLSRIPKMWNVLGRLGVAVVSARNGEYHPGMWQSVQAAMAPTK